MIHLNAHYRVHRDLWVNKVSVSFLKQINLKKFKSYVQLYRFGVNGLRRFSFTFTMLTVKGPLHLSGSMKGFFADEDFCCIAGRIKGPVEDIRAHCRVLSAIRNV